MIEPVPALKTMAEYLIDQFNKAGILNFQGVHYTVEMDGNEFIDVTVTVARKGAGGLSKDSERLNWLITNQMVVLKDAPDDQAAKYYIAHVFRHEPNPPTYNSPREAIDAAMSEG